MRFATFFFATAALAFGADTPKLDATAAFARLKTLVGNWQADSPIGKAYLSYEIIAGGTAIVEKETFEKMSPMMTVFHLDNGKLMLTHYCHAGNQPRMQAAAFDPQSGEILFEFLDITNAPDQNAAHMHNARLRIENGALYLADWDFWQGGKKQSTESFRYTRVR